MTCVRRKDLQTKRKTRPILFWNFCYFDSTRLQRASRAFAVHEMRFHIATASPLR
jgi:hypothetical protein